MIQPDAYLERIGFAGQPEPDPESLFALQRAHLLTAPFENQDIQLGRLIRLDPASLFEKIVNHRRGGYCFELNGLFALLLESIGFQVARLSASSANDDGTYKAEFEHLALTVRCPRPAGSAWLVDVGWGDGPFEPLRLEESITQERGGRVYRLNPEDQFLVLEELLTTGGWLKHYRFDLRPHELDEFSDMNRYLQTSPDSMFTQKSLCTLFRPNGRITLSDFRLIETHNHGLRGSEEKTEQTLAGETERLRVLRELFGLRLD
jgi:N-hydroxyarylamine O-acetyltransferase